MAIGMAVDNAAETSGDFNKEAWDKYNALRVAIRVQHDDDGAHKSAGDVVLKALFGANTILYATTDDTPAALTVAASRIVGRASTGAIAALTAAQVLTILGLDSNLADLATAEVQQLENIGTTTISAAQWGYLGACGAGGGQLLAALTAGESDQLELIGSTTISAAQWGILGALTEDPIIGDGTAGRILRIIELKIENGTNASTLKCTVTSQWNGDTISITDNIGKGATTGDFTLDATGAELRIDAGGLTGNAVGSIGKLGINLSNIDLLARSRVSANGIMTYMNLATGAGTGQDMTVAADTGRMDVQILYITDA